MEESNETKTQIKELMGLVDEYATSVASFGHPKFDGRRRKSIESKLRTRLSMVEKETLERAAKVCDDASEFAITSEQESSFIYCATKIRNLKINGQ